MLDREVLAQRLQHLEQQVEVKKRSQDDRSRQVKALEVCDPCQEQLLAATWLLETWGEQLWGLIRGTGHLRLPKNPPVVTYTTKQQLGSCSRAFHQHVAAPRSPVAFPNPGAGG